MRKLFLIILFLLLLMCCVYAETKTAEKLNIGSKTTVSGKTITILYATDDGSTKVSVDGKKGIVKFGDSTVEINEMRIRAINFTYIDKDFVQLTLELTVDTQCGDSICNTNLSESNESCCTDCGCTVGECIGNICEIIECKEDKDCLDEDNCTIEKCIEKNCNITKIRECKSNDKCCPKGCSYNNDTDCEFLGSCEKDSDCSDNNSCTTDKCEGKPLECKHQTTEGCDFEGTCHNITERVNNMYCTEEGMKKQKENLERCDNNYECLANECNNNLCGKKSNKNIIIGLVIASIVLILITSGSYFMFRKKKENFISE